MTESNCKVSAFRCCLCPISSEVSNIQFRCCNCKLISYCGRDHQRKHWAKHKKFCQAIKSIMETWKLEHILDLNGNVTELTALQFREAKFMTESMIIAKLCRQLTEYERELIWFPRICNLCNSYDRTLNLCQKCFSVGYCSDKHRLEDMGDHLGICSQLHLCYNFRLEELPQWEVKCIPPAVDVTFPSDLFEMYRMSTVWLGKNHSYPYTDNNLPTTSASYRKFANVCNISNVATIIHVLHLTQAYKTVKTSTLTIHIVGANSEIVLFTRFECWLLFYWLLDVFDIELIFIGPELVANDDSIEISYDSVKKKTVHIIYRKISYEEFLKTNDKKINTTEPNLIMSFNCGFSEYENASNPWRPAIQSMLTFKNIPIAFTSYTRTEAITDLSVLRRVSDMENCDFEVVCDGDLNPFRDYRPFRNFVGFGTDIMYHSNGYLSVIIVESPFSVDWRSN